MSSIGWALYDPQHIADLGKQLEDYESFEQLYARVTDAVRHVAAVAVARHFKSVVIVSHGDCCLAVRMWGKGIAPSSKARAEVLKGDYISYCGVASVAMEVDTSSVESGDGGSAATCVGLRVKDWDWQVPSK